MDIDRIVQQLMDQGKLARMPPAIPPRAKQRPPDPLLDPVNPEDIPAWEALNKPVKPYTPGAYGGQLAKDVVEEFVPKAGDTEAQNIYRQNQALLGVMATGPGGGPGTMAAVKAKGGMWHPQATSEITGPLLDSLVGEHRAGAHLDPVKKGQMDWAEKAAKNWLNKYAGTADDPLKDLQIPDGHGGGDLIRWEDLTDSIIAPRTAEKYRQGDVFGDQVKPWLNDKVPPDEKIWDLDKNSPSLSPAGISASRSIMALEDYMRHVGDHMRSVMNPREWYQRQPEAKQLQIDKLTAGHNPDGMAKIVRELPEYKRDTDLSRYDLVRAVRETHAKDAQRAKDMEKTNADRGSIGVTPMKEYPDGFKWVEIDGGPPLTELPKGWKIEKKGNDSWLYDEKGEVVQYGPGDNILDAKDKLRDKALNHEGEIMGHCVGGYCEEVARGGTKIFSLRDPKGGSHVTIEVRPPDVRETANSPEGFYWRQGSRGEVDEAFQAKYPRPTSGDSREWRKAIMASPEYREFLANQPPSIMQIKGKQNRKPVAEYLPYVQDLVKSGKWDSVKDIEHSGMVDLKNMQFSRNTYAQRQGAKEVELLKKLYPGERYITHEQYDALYQKGGPLADAAGSKAVDNDPGWQAAIDIQNRLRGRD